MADGPKLLAKDIVCQSELFAVERMHWRFSNGVETHFERMRSVHQVESVMIVPVQDDGTVLLVREFAAGVEEYVLGFPKGSYLSSEGMLAAANRELMEEAGYGAKLLSHLGDYSQSPSYSAATISVVLAQQLYPQRLVGDEPEPLEVISWHLDDVDALLARTDLHEARSVAALLMVERLYRSGALGFQVDHNMAAKVNEGDDNNDEF